MTTAASPAQGRRSRSPLARWFAQSAGLDAVELPRATTLAAHALLLMVAYYVLKTVREPLLLAGGSAELKSYAQGTIATVLLALVPAVAALIRRLDASRLLRLVTLAAIATLGLFATLGLIAVDIGFAYYVWVGVFGVTILAQFWSHAALRYDTTRGPATLTLIMGGGAAGGLLGPPLCAALYSLLGPWWLLALGAALLAATLPLTTTEPRHVGAQHDAAAMTSTGAVAQVLRDPKLRLLAALVIVVNCVNSTGEYLLSQFVLSDAAARIAADPSLERGAIVAGFYARYFLAVNMLSLLLQLLCVRRVLLAVGTRGAVVVAPLIALAGYGAVAVAPTFLVLRLVKVLENSVDYSLGNTLRQVLYLDHAADMQRQSRAVIDTLCYRLGDLTQAAMIAIGVNSLALDATDFAWLNAGLAALWLGLALGLGRMQPRPRPRHDAFTWRGAAVPAGIAALALAMFTPLRADARVPHSADLFAATAPLEVTLDLDATLCHDRDTGCGDIPIVLRYADETGERRVAATARVRGQWRAAQANCDVPPLFLAFDANATQGTPFAGHELLPLTTHCRALARYEQYVLKEYLAYRLNAAVDDTSLRTRLLRVTYNLRNARPIVRYAFVTENFTTLARRRGEIFVQTQSAAATVAEDSAAMLELFEYLIGNTDWSIVRGHNVAHFARSDGRVSVVPYDFDFSGLVDAEYAAPPPQLRLRRVTDRLFRGTCRRGADWQREIERFVTRRSALEAAVDAVPGLTSANRQHARSFVAEFYAILSSPEEVAEKIVGACRPES